MLTFLQILREVEKSQPNPLFTGGVDYRTQKRLDLANRDFEWGRGNIEERKVSTDELKTTQDWIYPKIIDKYMGKDTKDYEPIQVVDFNGTLYITDGNHRYNAAVEKGNKYIKAKVMTIY
jgi:hypothetical protein